jgi:hypothetical protein
MPSYSLRRFAPPVVCAVVDSTQAAIGLGRFFRCRFTPGRLYCARSTGGGKTLQGRESLLMRWSFLVALLVLLSGSPVQAAQLLLSTTQDASLGGQAFEPEDLVLYDTVSNAASIYFDGDAEFAAEENVDAVFLLSNGNILLSTAGDATLGGLNFEPEDLVEYNIGSNVASLFFDGDAEFTLAEENIVGVWVFGNGNILLTTFDDASLGGQAFEPEDLVLYNPVSNVASIFFDGDAEFTLAEEEIDAFSLLANGNLILSTRSAASLGGLAFQPDDLVEYNPVTNVASLFFNGDLEFAATNENIDAVFAIPEPSTAALLAVGLVGLIAAGRRRK